MLAEALDSIHGDFRIRAKVRKTTTDSGSNFVKAFSIFGSDDSGEISEATECVRGSNSRMSVQ